MCSFFKSLKTRSISLYAILCLSLIGTVSNSYSHGSLTIRIQEKTIEISIDSLNAELYFERGFLYQQHYEYDEAISDFNKAENLGYTQDILHYHRAETYLSNNNPQKALESVIRIFNENTVDVKIYKLRAQIFYALKEYSKAIESYQFVLDNMIDIRPDDIIEYATIILAQNPINYDDALVAIEKGLEKLGDKVLTLNLKKLEYLIASNQVEKAIEQYNYFIISNKRKEFWYYKKATYLISLGNHADANIALQQSKTAVALLKPKTQNTIAMKRLITQINELEKTLTL